MHKGKHAADGKRGHGKIHLGRRMKKCFSYTVLCKLRSGLITPSTRMMSVPSSFMWAINNSYPLLDLSFFNMCRSHGDEPCELLPCGAKRRILFLLSWSSYFLTCMNKKCHIYLFQEGHKKLPCLNTCFYLDLLFRFINVLSSVFELHIFSLFKNKD